MTLPSARPDVVVVGGGIVGMATAEALLRAHPDLRVTLLEKEADVAQHQTGHNSGVVHSGIYYRPGTLRAKLCVAGVGKLRAFCQEHGVAYDEVGKVIVATDPSELPRLDDLFARGTANGVPDLAMIGQDEIRQIEPHAAGIKAIHSPRTAIADFPGVTRALRSRFEDRGGVVRTGVLVEGIRATGAAVTLATDQGPIEAGYVITCGGLHADRLARMAGADVSDVLIVPFRGEYYVLEEPRRYLVRGLIYPVPDPSMPFLGVHLTRTVHGEVEAGPNAVWALKREGYGQLDVRLADAGEAVVYPGLWRLASRYWRTAAYEAYRSFSKRAFVEALQRLVPALGMDDVRRGGAGVRAQALGRDGAMIDDFVIRPSPRALHVINAPSPAATAGLAIGEHLVGQAQEAFGL